MSVGLAPLRFWCRSKGRCLQLYRRHIKEGAL